MVQHNSQETIFKSGQIVCLELQDRCLYGEVIQVAIERQLCWVRPLTIAVLSNENYQSFDFNRHTEIIDLRSASDLLLPLSLFRASYDTEAIGLLTELAAKEQPSNKQKLSQNLNNFIQQVCQTNTEKFSS